MSLKIEFTPPQRQEYQFLFPLIVIVRNYYFNFFSLKQPGTTLVRFSSVEEECVVPNRPTPLQRVPSLGDLTDDASPTTGKDLKLCF